MGRAPRLTGRVPSTGGRGPALPSESTWPTTWHAPVTEPRAFPACRGRSCPAHSGQDSLPTGFQTRATWKSADPEELPPMTWVGLAQSGEGPCRPKTDLPGRGGNSDSRRPVHLPAAPPEPPACTLHSSAASSTCSSRRVRVALAPQPHPHPREDGRAPARQGGGHSQHWLNRSLVPWKSHIQHPLGA